MVLLWFLTIMGTIRIAHSLRCRYLIGEKFLFYKLFAACIDNATSIFGSKTKQSDGFFVLVFFFCNYWFRAWEVVFSINNRQV